MRTLSTPVQLTTAVTNPIVRVSFCDRVFCTNFTVTVSAALTAGAANRSRDAPGLGPCLLRRSRFYKKNFFAVTGLVLLTHSFDDMVSEINRIKRHKPSFLQASPQVRVIWQSVMVFSLFRLSRDYCLLVNKSEKIFSRHEGKHGIQRQLSRPSIIDQYCR